MGTALVGVSQIKKRFFHLKDTTEMHHFYGTSQNPAGT
jgi:hypothetical protein